MRGKVLEVFIVAEKYCVRSLKDHHDKPPESTRNDHLVQKYQDTTMALELLPSKLQAAKKHAAAQHKGSTS
ncbi:hypothetical protein GJ744_011375 [Endocarpon pusillum]|uniref:Uncharacterized protein n=1 Tax=Endocarpon pusillum TaxID=364733 RepID=A0A8H7ACU6_9EURO|nr:hypothetical protein GJ744_011375 [Endocarpon pusillum]